ncbi:MAG: response regulator transcription factor [Oscillospiraceae bacterium]|nr:response regulator transcription factor [Oscillospiraceae bacterium]
MNSLILVVEDEKGIRNFISTVLTSNDYNIIQASTGHEALSMVTSYVPDLIILDLGLTDMDGLDVLKSIRTWSNIPIVVVSARTFERDKVFALDLGADDYITKPFGTQELLARIRTAIRHSKKDFVKNNFMKEFKMGNLRIDYEKRIVYLNDREIHFTKIEYKILMLLSQNAGKVLTYDFLIKEIWGPYTNENQTLRVNMANIRRKIEENPGEPKYILTEVGVGYRMVEEVTN